ncbi:MAG: hypothetical protein RL885_09020 [Planctomycetota bacterium]
MPSHLQRPTVPLVALVLILTTAACSTYEFANARRADGSWDLERLRADLEASGEERLIERTWIPLIYLDVTRFEATGEDFPSGYRVFHGTAYGPLLFCASDEDRFYDEKDRELETWSRWGVAWGIVRERTTEIPLPRWRRIERTTDVLLGIFGGVVTRYDSVERPRPSSDMPEEGDSN